PVPKLAISAVTGGTALLASNMTMVDATHCTYVYSGQAGNGTATVTLSTGTDLAGNVITATPTSGATFIVDNTAPTVSIGPPSATTTRSGPVSYTVTYADANFNTSTLGVGGDITPTTTGTATASIAVTGTGMIRTVTLSNITGDGPLGISLAAGTATDTAGNPAPTATSATFTVDNSGPAITSVSKPANGSYKAGQNLDFTVTFNEKATVIGTPAVGLTIGATGRNASYVSGSGTSALLFRYTIVSGDNDADGIAVAPAISLNGGTIKDALGNDASFGFTAPDTSAVLVDNTAPTAALTYSPASSAKSASKLTITATFSEPLAVSPVVKLAISALTTG